MRSTVKKTFAIAAARGADLIVHLKANQQSLCRQVKDGCAKSSPATTFQSLDRQKRNRHETRTTSVFAASAIISDLDWRNGATLSRPSFASNGSSRTSSPRPACGNDRARSATIYPTVPSMPALPPMPSAVIGTSKIAHTMSATSRSVKTPPVFEPTPVSSQGSAASPPTYFASTRSDPSDRTDTPPLSVGIKPSPSCASVERTEQPWHERQAGIFF